MKQPIQIEVYGANIVCASCVNAPTSKDTYDWLQAAVSRKYPELPFSITYIDIEEEIDDERQREIAQKVQDDEFFYPLVLVNEEVVGEGYIQLKDVYKAIEK